MGRWHQEIHWAEAIHLQHAPRQYCVGFLPGTDDLDYQTDHNNNNSYSFSTA